MKYSLESEYLIKQSRTDFNKNHEEGISNEKFEHSGYYLYDEQFLRLNGTRQYRLTLFGAILNILLSERILRCRIPKNTKKFILDSKEK